MKKTLGVVAAAALAAAPAVAVFATDVTGPTDTIVVTIADNCTLGYDTTTAHPSGSWEGNTLTTAIATGGVNAAMGTTKLSVVCNDSGNSKITVNASDLTDASISKSISYAAAEPQAGISTWGIYNGSTWIASNGVVKSYTGSTAADTVTVTYGAGLSSTQEAGTYTGTAAYTLTHPVSQ